MLCVSVVLSFLLLSYTPLYRYSIFWILHILFSHSPAGWHRVVCNFRLLWIMPPYIIMCFCFFFLDRQQAEFLGHRESIYLAWLEKKLPNLFWRRLYHFSFPLAIWEFQLFHVIFNTSLLSIFSATLGNMKNISWRFYFQFPNN